MFGRLILVNILLLLSVLLLSSCGTHIREASEFVPNDLYEMHISYDQKEEAFLFQLKSYSARKICVPRMSWPSRDGSHYFFGDKRIHFTQDDVRYDIKNGPSLYCTPAKKGDCVYVLNRNGELEGKISIEDFVVPSRIYMNSHFDPKLHFPYRPRFCE